MKYKLGNLSIYTFARHVKIREWDIIRTTLR